MDGNHPNRKKDKQNPYTLSIENGTYYIAFADGQGIYHKQEISMELYAAFNSFELDDISHMNAVSRHLEQSELTVESLTQRAFNPPEPLEDHVFRKMMYGKLHKAIDMLPEVQRRRLRLYYFGGNTYDQIAQMEGCTKMAVKFSIDIAIKKLRDKF